MVKDRQGEFPSMMYSAETHECDRCDEEFTTHEGWEPEHDEVLCASCIEKEQ